MNPLRYSLLKKNLAILGLALATSFEPLTIFIALFGILLNPSFDFQLLYLLPCSQLKQAVLAMWNVCNVADPGMCVVSSL